MLAFLIFVVVCWIIYSMYRVGAWGLATFLVLVGLVAAVFAL